MLLHLEKEKFNWDRSGLKYSSMCCTTSLKLVSNVSSMAQLCRRGRMSTRCGGRKQSKNVSEDKRKNLILVICGPSSFLVERLPLLMAEGQTLLSESLQSLRAD